MAKSSMMRTALRWARPLLATLVIGAAVLLSGEQARSQGATSPTDLMQIFQSLPQEQQDAIVRQFGASGGGAAGILGALGGGERQGARGRRSAVSEAQESEAAPEAEPPGLKGDDWVIIQVVVAGAKPSAPAPVAAPAPAVAPFPALPAGAAGGATQSNLANLLAATATAPTPPPGNEVVDAATMQERDRLQHLVT